MLFKKLFLLWFSRLGRNPRLPEMDTSHLKTVFLVAYFILQIVKIGNTNQNLENIFFYPNRG